MPSIDLNADIGEGTPDIDDHLLQIVSSANIACGGHCGDYQSMARSVASCLLLGVRIGAHPSYPDLAGFGRSSLQLEANVLTKSIIEQVSQLQQISKEHGGDVDYLKPHGALYNDAAREEKIAVPLIRAAETLGLSLMCLGGSPIEGWVRLSSIVFISEGFADRRYLSSGGLTPRSVPGALITDPLEATSQALTLAPHVDSICIHSDTPGAIEIAAAVRQRLTEEGWDLGA